MCSFTMGNHMPSNQSLRIGRPYTRLTFRLGILLGSLLITALMPGGQGQPANAHSKETFTYKKVGDVEIKADVYRPAGAGPHPAIVWIHGGGLMFGSRAMLPADENDLFLRVSGTSWSPLTIAWCRKPSFRRSSKMSRSIVLALGRFDVFRWAILAAS